MRFQSRHRTVSSCASQLRALRGPDPLWLFRLSVLPEHHSTVSPSAPHTNPYTAPALCASVPRLLPPTAQTLRSPSSPAVTMELPSGDHLSEITAPVCAGIFFISRAVVPVMLKMRHVPSVHEHANTLDARCRPISGPHAMDVTYESTVASLPRYT